MPLTTTQAILVAGTALSASTAAAGAMASSKGQAQQAKMQGELARRQAEREREIGALNASQQREKNKRAEGTQRALLAGSSGRDIGEGSALLVQEELAEEGEFNARILENNAAGRVSSLEADRVLALSRASQARSGGAFRAGSALLSGGLDIAKIKK